MNKIFSTVKGITSNGIELEFEMWHYGDEFSLHSALASLKNEAKGDSSFLLFTKDQKTAVRFSDIVLFTVVDKE